MIFRTPELGVVPWMRLRVCPDCTPRACPVYSGSRACDDALMRGVRSIQTGLAATGGVLGVLAYEVQMDNLPSTTSLRSWAGVVAAWSFLLAGLIAWRRRPRNRLGPLMVLTCFALLARQFRYSHDELAFTVFFLLGEVCWVLVAHVTLAYP